MAWMVGKELVLSITIRGKGAPVTNQLTESILVSHSCSRLKMAAWRLENRYDKGSCAEAYIYKP